MGKSLKPFSVNDRTSAGTILHESIPITGTLVSGTYNIGPSGEKREDNIKTYSHGMYQTVYDYPYASSSANLLFDVCVGFSPRHSGSLSASAAAHTGSMVAKKVNIYNQFAKVLNGHNDDGSIKDFDADGNVADGGIKHANAIFLNFSRLLYKDEIKKGSFSMLLGTGAAWATPFGQGDGTTVRTISDSGSLSNYRINSPAGEYGIIKESPSGENVGLIYYQAGVVVLTSSVFNGAGDITGTGSATFREGTVLTSGEEGNMDSVALFTTRSIDMAADSIRRRIQNISFNNTTELNSTIFFCKASHNEFNYSSNPTYLNGSKIRVKNDDNNFPPSAYITSVGLYSPEGKLLAVAKLSEPLKKSPHNDLTVRVRLDY